MQIGLAMQRTRVVHPIFSLVAALCLSACGGGGATPAAAHASLASLGLSLGNLAPAFDPAQTNYDAGLVAGDQLLVTPTASESGAVVTVEGAAVASGSTYAVALPIGPSTVRIVVTSSDGASSRTYEVQIDRTSSQLASLDVAGAALAPAFDPGVLQYAVNGGLLPASISLMAILRDPGASLAIDGVVVASGQKLRGVRTGPGTSRTINVRVTARDGSQRTYAVEWMRSALTRDGFLKAALVEQEDFFAHGVAIDGDTLVVTAHGEDSDGSGASDNSADRSGAAYVFVRQGGAWVQQAMLKMPFPHVGDDMGWREVAISGDTIAVSASDASPGRTGFGQFGSRPGVVLIFVRSGSTWSLEAEVAASVPGSGDEFGQSLDLDGDVLVVGAPLEDGDGTAADNNDVQSSGAAYAFRRMGTAWIQEAYLKSPTPLTHDNFGTSVAVSGDTLVVGTSRNEHAVVFARQAGGWAQQAVLVASNGEVDDEFGRQVALDGDTIAVGAWREASDGSGPDDNSVPFSGAVYIFERTGTTWAETDYLKSPMPADGDWFGAALALAGDSLIVGSPRESSDGSSLTDDSVGDSGIVHIYARGPTGWEADTWIKAALPGFTDWFGESVATDGHSILVGTPREDADGSGAADDSAVSAGAAHAFR